jgi:hypothetical protein
MTAYAIPALLGKPHPVRPSRSSQVTVSVRIEGERESLSHSYVTLGPSKILDARGELHSLPFPTPFAAVKKVAEEAGLPHVIEANGETFYLKRLGNESNGWQYRVNDLLPMIPAQNCQLRSSDEVVWFHDHDGCKSPLRIVPDRAEVWKGERIHFRVEQFNDSDEHWHPARDAIVVVENSPHQAPGGHATIDFSEEGAYSVHAEKGCAIRSLKKIITVEEKRPIKVRLRVEDNDCLLWEGQVTFCGLDAEDIHGKRVTIRRPVLIGALEAGAKRGDLRYKMIHTAEGLILFSINGLTEDNRGGSWWYKVNEKNISDDVDEYVLKDGDSVVFYRSKNPKLPETQAP